MDQARVRSPADIGRRAQGEAQARGVPQAGQGDWKVYYDAGARKRARKAEGQGAEARFVFTINISNKSIN